MRAEAEQLVLGDRENSSEKGQREYERLLGHPAET